MSFMIDAICMISSYHSTFKVYLCILHEYTYKDNVIMYKKNIKDY